ncbi:hypothetical protein HDU84_001513 [Entophlyctis sp. JEL0112]|nr:hypothetical protein HDU84_001513 [Entophlyctis sp. JEL0112]
MNNDKVLGSGPVASQPPSPQPQPQPKAQSQSVAPAIPSRRAPEARNPFILDDFALNSAPSRLIKENWTAAHQRVREREFCDFFDLSIFTGTWNVNGQDPTQSIKPWLQSDCDIYALGFQELDLSAEIYLISDNTKQTRWCEMIEDVLAPSPGEYQKVAVRQLIGLLIVVYAKKSIAEEISEVSTDAVGTGFLGAGNKGGVSCRFRVRDSYLCFVNAHLAADTNQVDRRNHDFSDICKRTKFPVQPALYADLREYIKQNPCVYSSVDLESLPLAGGSGSPTTSATTGIFDCDHLFFMGDLNYRVPLPDTTAKVFLADNQLDRLLEHDQLNAEKRSQRVLQGFQEAPINFRPTYKFDVGTDDYDTSEKRRSPSWCDRVFWYSNPLKTQLATTRNGEVGPPWIRNLSYKSINELRISDHKPVAALFKCLIRTVDPRKFELVTADLLKDLDRLENDAIPRIEIDTNSLEFGHVKYLTSKSQIIAVKNIGKSIAHFRFVPKTPQDTLVCKIFYTMSPQTGVLSPGQTVKVTVTVQVRDLVSAQKLNFGIESLSDTFVLHTDHSGADAFITTSGVWLPSVFGNRLDILCSITKPVRFCGGVEGMRMVAARLDETAVVTDPEIGVKLLTSEAKEMIANPREDTMVPKELWRLVDFIYRYGMDVNNLFRNQLVDTSLMQYTIECLDSGAEFDVEALLLDSSDEPAEIERRKTPEPPQAPAWMNQQENPSPTQVAVNVDDLMKGSGNVQALGPILKLTQKRKGRISAVRAFGECFVRILDGLAHRVVVPQAYMSIVLEGYLDAKIANTIIMGMPVIHATTFVYVMSFLSELVSAHGDSDAQMNAETIARMFAPVLISRPDNLDISMFKDTGGFGLQMREAMFLMHFLKGSE